MKNLFDIKDKVVVITGGTGVLGKAIAFHLAEEGAKVVILGRKAEIGDAIAGEIKANGGEAMFLTTDVMNRELLEQNLADILKAYGRIDALLNAVGGNMPGATIAPTGTFFDLKIEEFQRVLELNLTGSTAYTSLPQTDGGAEGRCYCQLLQHGCFPPHDACSRICCRKSRYLQFHSLHGYGSCQEVW